MTLDTIYGSKKAAAMMSPACVAATMASVVVVKSPIVTPLVLRAYLAPQLRLKRNDQNKFLGFLNFILT
jgi:hypothetical protein